MKLLLFVAFTICSSSFCKAQDTLVEVRGRIIKGYKDTVIVRFFSDSIEFHSMLVYSDTNYNVIVSKHGLRQGIHTEYLDPREFRFMDSIECLGYFPDTYSCWGHYFYFDTLDNRLIYNADFKIKCWTTEYTFTWEYLADSMAFYLENSEQYLGCIIKILMSKPWSKYYITLQAYSGLNESQSEALGIERAKRMKAFMVAQGYPEDKIRIKYLGKARDNQERGYIAWLISDK